MSIVQMGVVCDMHPGCIRPPNKRATWGITLSNGDRLLFVWADELKEDARGKWANLYAPEDYDRHGGGGKRRLEDVMAVQLGLMPYKPPRTTKGFALIGFNIPDGDGNKHWWIERGEIHNPYRIVEIEIDAVGVTWGRLERAEPKRIPAPYRRTA